MLVLSASAHATALFRVTVNTSSLIGSSSAPFALDFQFNNGSILNNNTVTVDNFQYDGGAAVGAPTLFGGVTGNIGRVSSSITRPRFRNSFRRSHPDRRCDLMCF